MGISITAFNNGDVMDPAVTTTNFTTIRNWLNGGIVAGDIPNNTVPTRAFRKLEHNTGTNPRTEGVTGKTMRSTVSSDPVERVYCTVDSHGVAVWETVATMSHYFYVEDGGYVEGVWEWWAWAIQSDQTAPEQFQTCEFRITLNGTDITATHRELRDAGHDATAQDSGQFVYAARNFQSIFQRSVSAGWNSARLQVKINSLASRTKYALIIIGARQKHLEYWRNA